MRNESQVQYATAAMWEDCEGAPGGLLGDTSITESDVLMLTGCPSCIWEPRPPLNCQHCVPTVEAPSRNLEANSCVQRPALLLLPRPGPNTSYYTVHPLPQIMIQKFLKELCGLSTPSSFRKQIHHLSREVTSV